MNSMARRTAAAPFHMPSAVMSSHVSAGMAEDSHPGNQELGFGTRKSSYFGQFFESKRLSKASMKKKRRHLKALLAEKARLKDQTGEE